MQFQGPEVVTMSREGIVNSLRANLDERYKDFFCIVQELLQNADDAGASTFAIGMFERLSEKHELLNTPGVLVLNNGKVTESDRHAIFFLHQSNKSSDAGKIGKFGLGMKSVLHLCENFFRFGPTSDTGENGEVSIDFWDPWIAQSAEETPSQVLKWSTDFKNMRQEILSDIMEQMKGIIGGCIDIKKDFLGLWLPLRKKEHCKEKRAMLEHYPLETKEHWFKDKDLRQVAEMMPFFRHLRKIIFISGWLEKYGTLERIPEKGKFLSSGEKGEWSGVIKSSSNLLGDMKYHGWEYRGGPEYSEIIKSLHEDYEKAKPHAAICYCVEEGRSSENSRLKLQECVVLPLSDKKKEYALGISSNITISYHAMYIVDAGRRTYKLRDDKEIDEAQIEWNCKLHDDLLLPNIVSTLGKFIKELNEEDITPFLKTLYESEFFKENEQIGENNQLLNVLTKDGWNWVVKGSYVQYLLLPNGEHSELMTQVYNRVNKKYLLVRSDEPRQTNYGECKWPSEQAGCIWEAAAALVSSNMRYDRKTLDFLLKAVNIMQVYEKQLPKIQKYLGGISKRQYQDAMPVFSELFLNYRHCRIKGFPGYITESSFNMWKEIMMLAKNCLPMYLPELPVDKQLAFRYSDEDLNKIIPALEKRLRGKCDINGKNVIRDIVCSVFKWSDLNWKESPLGKRRLFFIGEKLYSFEDLSNLTAEYHLFPRSGEFPTWGKILSGALKYDILAFPQEYDDIKEKIGLEQFNSQKHIPLIFQKYPEKRNATEMLKELLKLLKAPKETIYRNEVRYLLHGQKKYYYFEEKIVIPDLSTVEGKAELFKLGQKIIIKEDMPIVDREMLAEFSDIDKIKFGIKDTSLVERLCEISEKSDEIKEEECKKWRDYSSAPTWKLLINVSDSQEYLESLAELPIWQCTDKTYAVLGDCYLVEKIPIPDCVKSRIRELDISPQEKGKLKKKIKDLKIWGLNDVIKNCTQLPASKEVVKILEDAISKYTGDLDRELLDILFKYELLETISGKNISYLSVVPKGNWSGPVVYSVDKLTDTARELWEKLSQCGNPHKNMWTNWMVSHITNVNDGEFAYGGFSESLRDLTQLRSLFINRMELPVLQLLEDFGDDKIDGDMLLREYKETAKAQRLECICTYISQRYEEEKNAKFMEYLVYFTEEAKKAGVNWKRVCLVNEEGEARKVSDMVRGGDSLDNTYLLHRTLRRYFDEDKGERQSSDSNTESLDEFEKEIWKKINLRDPSLLEEEMKACATKLWDFFSEPDWPIGFDKVIEEFIMLVSGNNEHVRKRFQNSFNRDLDDFRREISDLFAEKIGKNSLIVITSDRKCVKVKSLTGGLLSIPINNNGRKTLLFGRKELNRRIDNQHLLLVLHKVEVQNENEALEYLQNTTNDIVHYIHENFDKERTLSSEELDRRVRDFFSKSMKDKDEQYDFTFVREMIIGDIFTFLEQTRLPDNSKLKKLMRKETNERFRKTTIKRGKNNDKEQEASRKLENYRKEAGELLENDKQEQEYVLNSVREKMGGEQYGYEASSVVFELFQNADDAAVELAMMEDRRGELKKEKYWRFAVELTEDALVVVHNGRAINQCACGAAFPYSKGEEKNFNQDLYKMLKHGISDKSDGTVERTGKFGFGFKSIYLLTDTPLIVSDKQKYSIMGGLLPRELDKKEIEKLAEHVNRHRGYFRDKAKLTVFRLPLCKGVQKDILDKFFAAAPLLVHFSRAISDIKITCPGKEMSFSWGEDKKYDVWELGKFQLAFGKCDGIPAELKESVASIWVTAPTQLKSDINFIINGSFNVDVGRNNLLKITEEVQKNIREAEKQLRNRLKTYEFQRRDDESFWKKLWEIFSNHQNSGFWKDRNDIVVQVFRSLVWGETGNEAGYGKFIRENKILPSGLEGRFDGPVMLRNVTRYTTEDLTSLWSLFEGFAEMVGYKPGQVISSKKGLVLKDIYDGLFGEPLGILELLRKVKDSGNGLPPELLNNKKWDDFCNDAKGKGGKYKNTFNELSLLNEAGKYVPLKNLLCKELGGIDTDYISLASKADCLSSKYDDEARKLFAYLRGDLREDSELIKKVTSDKNCQTSEMQNERSIILKRRTIQFCEGMEGSEEMVEMLTNYNETETISKTEEWEDWKEWVDNNDGWKGIERRWNLEKEEIIRKYNEKLYGTGELEPFPFELDSLESRERWMRLLILGAAHSLGRQKIEQHTGFLKFCKEHHFTHVFYSSVAEKETDIEEWNKDAEKWMGVIDDHIKRSDTEYNHWMSLYPAIYMFAKYLDRYVEFFKQCDRLDDIKRIEDITTFKYNYLLSGTGIDLPDLRMGIGGVGMSFVLRELYRSETLRIDGMEKFCFVPSQQNRKLCNVSEDNDASEKIFDFVVSQKVEDPTFDGQFDVAFQLLRGDR